MRISDWSSDVCSSDLFDNPVRTFGGKGLGCGDQCVGHQQLGVRDVREIDRHCLEFLHVDRDAAGIEPQQDAGELLAPVDRLDEVEPRLMALPRSEEHTSELQSLMRNSYAVFCLKKKKDNNQ